MDTNAYAQLRNAFARKTGASASMATDFVAANEEKYNGPAILVGDTNYEESKTLQASIKNNEYAAELIGNKYVISYKCPEGFEAVLKKIKSKIAAYKSNLITIDESWNIRGTLDNVSFVPYIEGGWDESFDGGQGSTYCLKNECSTDEFGAYLKVLEELGFEHYMENNINGNEFKMLVTEDSIAYAMYFADTQIFKLSMDPRKTFALPTLEEDNIYEKTGSKLPLTRPPT
jgi:hypothetical protein